MKKLICLLAATLLDCSLSLAEPAAPTSPNNPVVVAHEGEANYTDEEFKALQALRGRGVDPKAACGETVRDVLKCEMGKEEDWDKCIQKASNKFEMKFPSKVESRRLELLRNAPTLLENSRLAKSQKDPKSGFPNRTPEDVIIKGKDGNYVMRAVPVDAFGQPDSARKTIPVQGLDAEALRQANKFFMEQPLNRAQGEGFIQPRDSKLVAPKRSEEQPLDRAQGEGFIKPK